MRHIKDFDSFLNESFKPDNDGQESIDVINYALGTNPGYAFFADDDQIEEFDEYWKNEDYLPALKMLEDAEDLDISDKKSLFAYLVDNDYLVMKDFVDMQKAIILISTKLPSKPGYLFFGTENDIKKFNNEWANGIKARAVEMIYKTKDLDIKDSKTLDQFIKNNV